MSLIDLPVPCYISTALLTCMHQVQVSMQCAEQMGCQDSIIKFVLPLGATVNMNGTALYEATTVIFIAQVRAAVK